VRAALSRIDVTISTIAPLEDGILRVKIESPTDERERIAAAIVEGGLGLRRLERASTEHEDVFLRLSHDTGKNLSKDEEARA
jgi:hypothetical protein